MSDEYLPRCDVTAIHTETVEKLRTEMPPGAELSALADFYKMFADTTRMGILYALSRTELCVCDIAFLLNMTQSAISHQLRLLKQARLVKFRREGRIVYYSLDDEHVQTIFDQAYQHLREPR